MPRRGLARASLAVRVERPRYTDRVRSAHDTAPFALHVRGVTRRLGGRLVLRDVSCAVDRGAIVAVVGANGAGKSSLVRAIAGRLALETGAIEIDGLPAAEARRQGRLGLVPQEIALTPHLSVRENLRLWGRLAGIAASDLDARLRDGLAAIGLADRGATRVDRLSGGMRRRVHVLAGLLHAPALVVLDEPTAGIDEESRGHLHALLRARTAAGAGVLYVSHDLDDVAALCDRVVVLDRGTVAADDTVAALVAAFARPEGEIVVTLDAPAGPASALEAEGLSSVGPLEWVGAPGGALRDPAAVEARLRAAGVRVNAITFRRATLHGAVAAAVARQRAAA